MEAIVRAHLHKLRIPGGQDRVFKSECAYSFDTAESPGGLYTNLATFSSVGNDFLALDRQRTGSTMYLHAKSHRVPKPKDAASDAGAAQATAPTKLAIGVAGGFNADAPAFDVLTEHAIVIFTGADDISAAARLPHPGGTVDLPSLVTAVADAVIAIRDTGVSESAAATWEDVPNPSKYADSLVQAASGLRISPDPSEWKCGDCDKRDNLWLNLGDGHIGCGRKNWDGSGGNGHALAHFQSSGGLYPLCVKLGTITAAGGDIYSYAPDEDDMVTDPHLARHLAHWGINVMGLAKTERSMAELNVDLNASYDFSRICEGGKDLVAASGPGFIGLENLGNSCYMASVLQAVAALPQAAGLFVGEGAGVYRALCGSTGSVPADDLLLQTAKVLAGLTLDRYAAPPAPQPLDGGWTVVTSVEERTEASNAVALSLAGASSADAAAITHTTADDAATRSGGEVPPGPGGRCGFVVPRAFKTLIGRGHPEFASGRQQDAIQFFEYLLETLDKAHRKDAGRVQAALAAAAAGGGGSGGVTNLSQLFSYTVEGRLEDRTTPAGGERFVKYSESQERFWRLPIPMDAAVPLPHAAGSEEPPSESASKRARGEGGSPIAPAGAAPASGVAQGAPTRRVPFAACVSSWVAPAHITDWASPATTGVRGAASSTARFASFPQVLVVQLGRYTTAPDWTTLKLDASVPMPLSLTLDSEPSPVEAGAAAASASSGCIPSFSVDLRARGRQPGESDFPSAPAPAPAAAPAPTAPVVAASPVPVADAGLVSGLEAMGFAPGACVRSALAAGPMGGLEGAMEYLLAHMEDDGFCDPYVPPPPAAAAAGAAPAAGPAPADPASVAMLCDMGFDSERAAYALGATGGDLERAADWLFAHADEPLPAAPAAPAGGMDVDAPAAPAASAASSGGVPGSGRYELSGIISHMGRSTGSGHYVAHLRKGGQWYLFNDAKVAVSQDPPLDVGYLYVYQRVA